MAVLKNSVPFDPNKYEYSSEFIPSTNCKLEPLSAHTVPELIEALQNTTVDIDAECLAVDKRGRRSTLRFTEKQAFLDAYQRNSMREATDYFAYDFEGPRANGIGNDFIPLLGGPFNKQLYLADYLRMNSLCYFAYNHDPLARRVIHVYRDFVLGRGYKIECDDEKAAAAWEAFEIANDLPELLDSACRELSLYGETMLWKLPKGQSKITYNLAPGQEPPKSKIPRVRLIDPSCIWEIVTFPEDITRVLYYQWVSPTQYQIYTGQDGNNWVPNFKFIFRQLPPEEVNHYKINTVTGEKRGRSDLFPILGYLKRLRDAVEYSIVGMMKASAYCLDTTIKGNQGDIDQYIMAQNALGEIPPAGAEFVHTEAVERQYLSNSATAKSSGSSTAFDWCLSMIAAGTGIPVNYFGSHLGGATSRASALVATEPVAKLFEQRQEVLRGMIDDLWNHVIGEEVEYSLIFPEIVTQDKSEKIKDLALCNSQKWLSKQTCAEIAAKELGISSFDFDDEMKRIKEEADKEVAELDPLTGAPKMQTTPPNGSTPSNGAGPASGISSKQRNDFADEQRTI